MYINKYIREQEKNGKMWSKKTKILITIAGLVVLFFIDDLLIAFLIRELKIFYISPVTFFSALSLFLFTNTLFAYAVYKIIKTKPVSGREGIIGEKGRALTAINGNGSVSVHGEIWKAESRAQIAKGDCVKVEAVDGLTLIVKKC